MSGPSTFTVIRGGADSAGEVARRAAGSADEITALRLDLAQIAFDIAGLVDPTPISDGAGTILAIVRGDFVGAGLSALGVIPYVGDLAKAGKFPRYLKTLERAAAMTDDATRLMLAPVMQRLDTALAYLPKRAGPEVERMRRLVGEFLDASGTARLTAKLADVSKQFQFGSYETATHLYKEARGRLGVPSNVKHWRDASAQSGLSKGLGDDAGHLVGNRFGAPGDARNLGLQNWRANRYGTFKQLENQWAQSLESGVGVEVMVRDIYKLGEARPYYRKVEWTEIGHDGRREMHEMIFMNSHTAKSRSAQEIPPSVLSPQKNNVRYLDDYR